MSIKEAILNIPIWKVAVSLLAICLLLVFFIEYAFMKTVFSTINHSITYFEKSANEDKKEIDSDIKDVNERQQYDAAMSEYSSAELHIHFDASNQERGCFNFKNIKRFEAMQKLAYVKQHAFAKKSVDEYLLEYRLKAKNGFDNHEFDPKLCEEKSV